MRPLFVVGLTVVVFGGMKLLMAFHATDRSQQHEAVPLNRGTGDFKVEILLTFEAGPDPFGLASPAESASVLVQLAGKEIYRAEGTVRSDVPIVIDQVPEIVEGKNQFYVEATPREQQPSYRAVGIRVLRDGIPIGEKVLLAEPGVTVQGTLTVEVPPSPGRSADDRDG